MISLRTLTSAAVVALASLTLAACNDGPVDPLKRGLSPSGANFDGKVGDVGNSAKHGDIDVRVLLDKSGNALLQIRTGSYTPATNTATPDGYFTSLQYKVYDANGKQVQVKNVNFSKSGVQLYSTYLDFCSSSQDDDDDDDSGHSTPTCTTKYGLNWTVTVQANLKDVNGDVKKTDVVREDSFDAYLPDLDIAAQKLYVVGAGGTQTLASAVPASAPITYSVPFPNNKPINGQPNIFSVTETCLVFVDNVLQVPPITNPITHAVYPNANMFDYVNGATHTISAGATSSCQFSLALSPGTHTIAVSALVTAPGDYDITNNTTAKFTVTASSGPPDVGVLGTLQKQVSAGTYAALGSLTLPAGQTSMTTTVYQQISQISLTTPNSVTCSVLLDGSPVTFATTPTVTPALNGVASTGYCGFPLTLTEGLHKVKVTAVSNPADNNAANDTVTTFVTVANGTITGTLSSALFLTTPSKVSIVSSPADVYSAATNHYQADVTLTNLTNTTTAIPVTCKVTVDNVELVAGASTTVPISGTSSVVLTWDATNGQSILLNNNQTAPCGFSLKFTESGNRDVQHTIKVDASSNATTPTATTATTGSVRDLVRVDLAAAGMKLVVGGVLSPMVSTPMGVRDTLAAVFHNPDATHSVAFTCQILMGGQPVTDTTFVALKTSATAAANGDADCRWSVKPLFLQSMAFSVTATPTAASPTDPSLANNVVADTLGVKSNGKFSSFDPTNTVIQQEWYNLTTSSTTGLPVEQMVTQVVQVSQLALLVIPTVDGRLGDFTMKANAISSTVTFPTGTVSGSINASSGPIQCIGVGPKQPYANPPADLPSQYGYFASICTQPTTFNGQPGFQQITVNYSQSIETFEKTVPVSNPGKWAIPPGTVDVPIQLNFTLVGSKPDSVKGTIRIPTGVPSTNALEFPNYPGMYQWLFLHPGPATIIQP